VRVILTRTGKLPLKSRLFHDGAAPTWVVTGGDAGATSKAARQLRPLGVEILAVAPGQRRRDGSLRLQHVLEGLGRRGIRRLLIEGGAEVATGFLAAGLVDRLHVHLAPLILGGEHPGWPGALGIKRLADGLALEAVEVRQLGADLAIVGHPGRPGRSRRRPARAAATRAIAPVRGRARRAVSK
jgi:diaminohydroxyphosphoribosylaminopyrimidine deaminase/5-amino-6-(5-phosphoribosylamino)uracil reductase